MFGSPINTYFTDNGLEVWTYLFSKQNDNAMNYVPYVNVISSGSKGTNKELKIIFSENGVVKNYSMNESKIENKHGLFR